MQTSQGVRLAGGCPTRLRSLGRKLDRHLSHNSMSSFLRTGDLTDTGLILRKRRGALTPRFKRGSEEQGDDVVEAAPFGLQADSPQDSVDADASEDEQTNLEEQLEASRETVSGEPSQIMTPAAVWLPYGDRKAAEETTARQPGGFAAALDALLSLPRRLAKWFLFTAQQLMTGPNIIAKLAGYFAVGVPVVLGCAVLYSWVSGKTLVEGFVQAYGNLYKVPGTVVLGDVNLGATVLNNITFFLGTFTFALILGIISEEVGERYRRVREGNYPVQTSGHTLILNWNSQLVPLLRQMRVAREERGAFQGSVVVLAEHDKEVMDRQLASALASNQTPSMQVTTRCGPPTSTHYLDRAAAATASTVVVLAPESHVDATSAHHDGAAEKQVASLLALQALRETFLGSGARALPPQTVILQSPPAPTASPAALGGSNMPSMDSMGSSVDSAALLASTDEAGASGAGPASPKRRHAHPVLDAARRLMDTSAQPVEFADLDLEGTMANVMAQSAVQPGVASVWCSLVQQTLGGAELYIRSFPQLSGLTYGEARRRFSDAVPIGYINFAVNPDVHGFAAAKQAQLQGAELALHGEQWPHVHLNPPDSSTLLDNSALVLVAKHGSIRPQGWEPQEFVLARQQHGATTAQSLSRTSSDSSPQSQPKHVFVLEWGADGESPPSHRVTRVVSALKACLPEDSMISVVGPSAPDVDCSMDSSSGASNMPHNMHHFEEGLHDKSIMQSVDADIESSEERRARARREPRRTVHLQYIPAAAGGRDLRRVVEDAGLAGADAAVVLSSSNGSDRGGVEADAHIISALVLLEDVVVRAGRTKRSPLHVLGTVQRPETVQVANHLMGKLGKARITAELLQPDELAAGVLTQMAAEPLLRPVLGAFMSTHKGPTIRLYQAARYALPIGKTLSFASVAERVRVKGETALGYINESGRMILGPQPAEEHTYGRDDRVVVLACE